VAISAEARVEVEAAVEQTFAELSDPARFHEWQTGMEPARVDDGPVGVGSRLRSRRSLAGMRMPFTSEITVWEPPRRMVFRAVRTPLDVTGAYLVHPLPSGSLVTARMDIAAPRLGPWRLGERAAGMIGAQLGRDLECFARLVARPNEQDGGAP
jgi:uncharacterized protein YndB with AHSA1/START domain